MGGSPAARAEALIRAGSPGSLDEAERLLREARAAGDSSELQLALALAAEQRGNRLRALAHLERAARLAPGSAGPRARLAALLLRLGQPADACRVARAALSRPRNEGDAEADGVAAAEALLREARCGR